MQHGLGVQKREIATNVERVIIDFEMLIETIEKYCIMDQEMATFTTVSSTDAGDIIFLVYEDILTAPDIVLKGLESIFSKNLSV